MDCERITSCEYTDFTDGKPVKSIGNWGNPPHHAIPRKQLPSNALTKFVRNECACWDKYGKRCIGVDVYNRTFRAEGPCWVMHGKPCEYFRKYVLCPEGYSYPNIAFQKSHAYEKKVRRLYNKIDKTEVVIAGRRCPGAHEGKECGAPLLPRRRYCDRCRDRRRRG